MGLSNTLAYIHDGSLLAALAEVHIDAWHIKPRPREQRGAGVLLVLMLGSLAPAASLLASLPSYCPVAGGGLSPKNQRGGKPSKIGSYP